MATLSFKYPETLIGATDTSVQMEIDAEDVGTLTATFSGDVSVTSHSFTPKQGGYYLNVTTANNTQYAVQESTVTVTDGNLTASATLRKNGPNGYVSITPSTATVTSSGATLTFNVESGGMASFNTNSWGTGNFNSISLNAAHTELTVVVGPNQLSNDIVGYVSVYGQDWRNYTKSDMVTITQYAGSSTGGVITLTPSYSTPVYYSTQSNFNISTNNINISTLTASYSGDLSFWSTSFNSDYSVLTVRYDANMTDTTKTGYVTVSGTDTDGNPVSATATIVLSGRDTTYIQLSPETVSVTAKAGYENLFITYRSIDTSTIQVTSSGDMNITGLHLDQNNEFVQVSFGANESNISKIGYVTITALDNNGNTVSSTAVLSQIGISPIWKPIFFSDDSEDDFIEYHIENNSNIVYAGKAYKYPDAESIEWQVNDVLSNYLGNGIKFEEGIQEIPNYSKEFLIVTNTGNTFTQSVHNSWAYEDADYLISQPIDNRVDPRQWLPVSFLSTENDSITVNSDVYNAPESNKGYTVMLDLSTFHFECGSEIDVEDGEQEEILYKYKLDCGDYVLYYSNKFGGWDSLLLNASSKKTDNIEHLNYRKYSRSLNEFSKVNYQNNITANWNLKTKLFFGKQGELMHNLLESTMVYLHILETNEIIPVVVTNSDCEYLNYSNNSRNPFFYEITVEESNTKLRK